MFALCLRMISVSVLGNFFVGSGGRNSTLSLLSLGFEIGEIRHPSGALKSTVSGDVGWWVN